MKKCNRHAGEKLGAKHTRRKEVEEKENDDSDYVAALAMIEAEGRMDTKREMHAEQDDQKPLSRLADRVP